MNEPATQASPFEVKNLIDAGEAYVVDVRETAEYAQAHIATAALMPLSSFDPGAVQPPAGKKLVFHCRSGQRCGVAAQTLRSAGYEGPIYRMTGGLTAWIDAGLPISRGHDR